MFLTSIRNGNRRASATLPRRALLLGPLLAAPAIAQRPRVMIVPFAVGGSSDVMGRAIPSPEICEHSQRQIGAKPATADGRDWTALMQRVAAIAPGYDR